MKKSTVLFLYSLWLITTLANAAYVFADMYAGVYSGLTFLNGFCAVFGAVLTHEYALKVCRYE